MKDLQGPVGSEVLTVGKVHEELEHLVRRLPVRHAHVVKRLVELLLDNTESEPIKAGLPGDEDLQWMEGDLSAELPEYDWGPEGPPQGRPVYHVPGVGIVIGEG